jgi:hypothetical protein
MMDTLRNKSEFIKEKKIDWAFVKQRMNQGRMTIDEWWISLCGAQELQPLRAGGFAPCF